MRRQLATIAVAITLLALGWLDADHATADELVCVRRGSFGQCQLWVNVPGQGGGQGAGSSAGSGSQGPCGEQQCTSRYGVWSFDRNCYVAPADPQPPLTDQIWDNHTDGVILTCIVSDALRDAAYYFWAASPAPPDPETLARRAVEYMNLSAIRIGSFPWTLDKSPRSMGIIGWNVWLWIDNPSPHTYGPITRSATAAGYTVTATGQVTGITWDMGNGDTITCGRGTPHPRYTTHDTRSPDCGYVYTHDGDYTITATTHWTIAWTGIGRSGIIPVELTATGRLTIAEIQVVNVPLRDT